MSVDIIEQLERYGDFLRDELTVGVPVVGLRPEVDVSPRRWRAWAVRGVASAAVLVLAVMSFAAIRRSGSSPLVASQVSDVEPIEILPTDTAAFRERLPDVDLQMIPLAPRVATEDERATVVEKRRDLLLVPASVEVVFEVANGPIAFEFDMISTGSGPLDCRRGRMTGERRGAELRLLGSSSCWDPTRPPTRADPGRPPLSYGCRPKYLFGGDQFGVKDFNVEITTPLGSPGAIFTLTDGRQVLVRPSNDLVFYMGPVAETVDVFYPDNSVVTERTGSCI